MTNVSHRSISFKEKEKDPGFLVAKGRFVANSERELQDLIKSGVKTDDKRILTLKEQIDSERASAEKKHVKDLASAIFLAVTNHGYATIRCIGRNACYNACKAMAIAGGYCQSKGIDLRFGSSFDEGNIGELRHQGHVDNVTALVFSLEGYKTLETT